MLTRISNLTLPIILVLAMVKELTDAKSSDPWTDHIVGIFWGFCWLGFALGLFFSKRWAWLGSLCCVGLMAAASLSLTGIAVLNIDSSGYITLIFGGAPLLVSVALLIGLLIERKKLIAAKRGIVER